MMYQQLQNACKGKGCRIKVFGQMWGTLGKIYLASQKLPACAPMFYTNYTESFEATKKKIIISWFLSQETE